MAGCAREQGVFRLSFFRRGALRHKAIFLPLNGREKSLRDFDRPFNSPFGTR
jgi:hypothetical protein